MRFHTQAVLTAWNIENGQNESSIACCNFIQTFIRLPFIRSKQDLQAPKVRRKLVDLWRGRRGLLVLRGLQLSPEESLGSSAFLTTFRPSSYGTAP